MSISKCCPCCRMPGAVTEVHFGVVDDLGVVLGLCQRCALSNDRLPAKTVKRRMDAAGQRAAESSGRYYTARFPDQGAAQTAAGMLAHPKHTDAMRDALGWI